MTATAKAMAKQKLSYVEVLRDAAADTGRLADFLDALGIGPQGGWHDDATALRTLAGLIEKMEERAAKTGCPCIPCTLIRQVAAGFDPNAASPPGVGPVGARR